MFVLRSTVSNCSAASHLLMVRRSSIRMDQSLRLPADRPACEHPGTVEQLQFGANLTLLASGYFK
jgi:hypothetical protein